MRTKKPKRNVWKDPSPYGTYKGERGSPEQWADAYSAAWDGATCKEIIKEETPYAILCIEITADWKVIRAAYLKLIQEHHPDHGGDEEICKKVIAAYCLLKEMRNE